MTLDPAERAELLRLVTNGDREAFRRLFEEDYELLLRQIFYRCQDQSLAEEIVQETFLRVWVKRGDIRPHQPFLPWISLIAMNLLRDHFRKKGIRNKYARQLRQHEGQANPQPDAMVHARILEERIRHVVNHELPPQCRLVFTLSRVEGMSYREISEVLGIKPKTVENHLCRALKIIRKSIGPDIGGSTRSKR